MKKAAIIAMALLLTVGIAFAKEYEVTKKAGEYTVTVSIDRNPPVVGDNAVSITVKDASGQIVKDANVNVDYSMPAMPGMPPMNYKTQAVLKGDEYKTTMGMSMEGTWNVEVKVTKGGKTSRMKFSVNAR